MILCDEQERLKKGLIRRKQHIVWIPDVWFQWKRDRIAVIYISPLFLPFISLSFICLYFEFLGSNSTPLPLKLEIYFTCIHVPVISCNVGSTSCQFVGISTVNSLDREAPSACESARSLPLNHDLWSDGEFRAVSVSV